MWFALATPLVVMVAAVLMERVERYCTRTPVRAAERRAAHGPVAVALRH
ncbi:hypothetical protein [Amycolatopsis jejuensis]|nr:hypothetical protein [Amycolatopsis jejuensis]